MHDKVDESRLSQVGKSWKVSENALFLCCAEAAWKVGETQGFECLGYSNWTIYSLLSQFCSLTFPTSTSLYWGAQFLLPQREEG